MFVLSFCCDKAGEDLDLDLEDLDLKDLDLDLDLDPRQTP